MGPECRDDAPAVAISGEGNVGLLTDKVAAVRVTGATPELSATLSKFIMTKPGDELGRAAIAEDVRRLWAVGVVIDVRVDAVSGHDGAELTFAVTPQPLIERVEISGDARDDLDLRRLRALAGTPYEAMRVARMASAIEHSMVYKGYLDAKIHVHRTPVGVCVRAKRGPLVTIDKIVLEGRHDVPESALISQLRSGKGINQPGGIFDEDMLSEDYLKMEYVYYDHGKANIRISTPKTERHGNHVDVTVPITEGPTFHLGKLDVGAFAGHRVALGIATGDLFKRTKITAAIERIQDRIDPGDWVYPQTQIDLQNNTMDVHFAITWRHLWDSLLLLPRR
jgi:outer membrane protein assembly factor BamA